MSEECVLVDVRVPHLAAAKKLKLPRATALAAVLAQTAAQVIGARVCVCRRLTAQRSCAPPVSRICLRSKGSSVRGPTTDRRCRPVSAPRVRHRVARQHRLTARPRAAETRLLSPQFEGVVVLRAPVAVAATAIRQPSKLAAAAGRMLHAGSVDLVVFVFCLFIFLFVFLGCFFLF